jgi:AcrR family transcriptional regulator
MAVGETSRGVRQSRLTRAQAKGQTRERLLEAARRVFVERGFHATTLDQVAEEAGHTKGAVYSAFESKADLFLAIFEERIRRRAGEVKRIATRANSLAELAQAGERFWIATLRNEREWSLLLLEFEIYAARDAVLRKRLAGILGLYRSAMCEAIEAVAAASGERLAVPAERLTVATLALGNGIMLEGLTGATSDTVEVYRAAFALFLRGAAAPGDMP